MSEIPATPNTRKEAYLAAAAGQAVEYPAKPITREEAYLKAIAEKPSGGSGTTDYEQLKHKPQIGGVELSGNKTAAQLGLATEQALSGKQDALSAGNYIDIDGNEISVNRVIPNEEVSYEIVTKSTSSDPYTNAQTVKKFVNGTEVSSADYTRYSVEQEYAEHKVVFDDVLWLGYGAAGTQGGWSYGLLVASDDHSAGYVYEWGWNSEVDVTEDFSVVDHSGEKLIIKSEMDAAIAGKQNALTAGDYIQFAGNEISVKRDPSLTTDVVVEVSFGYPICTITKKVDNEVIDTATINTQQPIPATVWDIFSCSYNVQAMVLYLTNLKASKEHAVGYQISVPSYSSGVIDTQTFVETVFEGDKLIVQSELDAAVGYSTDEVDTGVKWIDGKNIYRKVYNNVELTNNVNVTIEAGFASSKTVLNMYGVFTAIDTGGTQVIEVSSYVIAGNAFVHPRIINGDLKMVVAGDMHEFVGFLVVEYTKSTT